MPRIKKRFFFIFVFSVFLSNPLFSSLFKGGEILYECIGEGSLPDSKRYKITLNIYYGCLFNNVWELATLFLNDGDGWNDVVIVTIDTVQIYYPPEDPCLILTEDACLSTYVLSTEVELPVINDNYLFAFGSCCRDNYIVNNEEIFGVRYLIKQEIIPTAQQQCNSNPQFVEYPPTVLCANEPIEIPQHAIDPNGDQLAYKFCSPLVNIDGQWPPTLPFPTFNFAFPEYSTLNPFGQNTISIDANTGLMTGNAPSVPGKYLTKICVEEFRNGQLIGAVERDITFNVASCIPLVDAVVSANTHEVINSEGQVIINACNDNLVQLMNNSTDSSFISQSIWIIDYGNEIDTFYEWSPILTFPEEGGSFQGQLLLNPDSICSDEVELTFNITSNISADFTFEYDTCVAGPVQFFNHTELTGSQLVRTEWEFGDENQATQLNPLHGYSLPSTYEVSFSIEDSHNCKDSIVKTVNWRPAPPIILVSPDFSAGCSPLEVTFNNLSLPIDSTYQVEWDFGDQTGISDKRSPSYEYNQTGLYDVFVSITSPIGCYIDTVFNDLIFVEPGPLAQFSTSPEQFSNFNNEVVLINKSQRDVQWKWLFDAKDSTIIEEPTYTFADTGIHQIQLLVWDQYDCQDSISMIIDVVPQNTYFLPNAFTPNSDGKNDLFIGKGILDGVRNFKMSIIDRWGQVVFSTTNPDEGWNGQMGNTGKQLPNGVYVCNVSFKKPRGEQEQLKGFVTLLR